ncbi:MAG: T9SS type A sorting domain-containing protein [Bacteroidia bacterium]|nr:T9SS type A sorting domain-containing protein [Bacteroidia bacterium]
MKKIGFAAVLLISGWLSAQTTATDWTANDCSGNPHNLFTELNQGKVIVMAWVMPCGVCITPTLTAYNVAQSFASSGCDVEFYLIDDYGNTNCATLTNWGTTNNIGPNTINFSNAAIDMTAYGAAAMPKIVVVGGPTHTVYTIQNNSVNSTTVQNAITQACLDIVNSVKDVSSNVSPLVLTPNPVTDKGVLTFSLQNSANLQIEIYDLLGSRLKTVSSSVFAAGDQKVEWSAKDLAPGIYFLKVSEGTRARVLKFVVQ